MPQVRRVLETALYVKDLERSARFYERVVRSEYHVERRSAGGDERREGTVLLLFRRGGTAAGASFPGGWIPPHDGTGPAHFAFAIASGELDSWLLHLATEGIEIESEVSWDRGGKSVYFPDPDGHAVELATPGVWKVY